VDRVARRAARRPGRLPVRRPGPRGGSVRAAPAFLDVGSAETFRDEVVTYATRLWQAGKVAELHVWPGGFHGFDGLIPQATLSQACQPAQMEWLRRLLAE